MNLGIVARVLGFLLLGMLAMSLLPLLLAIAQGDPCGPGPWLWMTTVTLLVALLLLGLGRRARVEELSIREGIAITSLVWIVASLLSAIGMHLATPEITFIEAWFESMSGFTTTGSTIFGDQIAIPDLNRSVQLWRHLTQWLGGLGIVVISLSLLPLLSGGGGFSLYRAEVPGITNERLAPRIADTARLLLFFYGAMTVCFASALWLSGASWFDSIGHSMSAISTGGFSTFADSVDGLQSAAGEWILILCMFCGGLSFAVLLAALRGRPLQLWRNLEARIFLLLVLLASVLTALLLVSQSSYYSHDPHALLRHSLFNVTSTATSTGFAVGYQESGGSSWAAWPAGAQMMLLLLMVVGGCTGGTGGGSKVARWVVSWKALRGELRRYVEPARVTAVTIDGRPLHDRLLIQVAAFFFVMLLSWALGALLMSLAGNDLQISASAAITALTNNGPGWGGVGVDRNFAAIGPFSQLVCIALMLIGRLEFFGIIALCSRRHWQR